MSSLSRSVLMAAGFLCLWSAEPALAQAHDVPSPRRSPAPVGHPVPQAVRHASAGTRLYGPAARRMVRSFLRLRLLELRAEELERVRAVLERHLGPDALFGPAGPAASARSEGFLR